MECSSAVTSDGRIETRYLVATVAPLKGAAAGMDEIRMPGGEVAGRGLLLPGLPRLHVGQQVLLFLTAPSAGRGWRVPVGLGAGAYEVLPDPAGGMASVVGMGTEGADSRPRDHAQFLSEIQAEIERQRHAR